MLELARSLASVAFPTLEDLAAEPLIQSLRVSFGSDRVEIGATGPGSPRSDLPSAHAPSPVRPASGPKTAERGRALLTLASVMQAETDEQERTALARRHPAALAMPHSSSEDMVNVVPVGGPPAENGTPRVTAFVPAVKTSPAWNSPRGELLAQDPASHATRTLYAQRRSAARLLRGLRHRALERRSPAPISQPKRRRAVKPIYSWERPQGTPAGPRSPPEAARSPPRTAPPAVPQRAARTEQAPVHAAPSERRAPELFEFRIRLTGEEYAELLRRQRSYRARLGQPHATPAAAPPSTAHPLSAPKLLARPVPAFR
eukprot:tig00001003_g6284.t1